MINGPGKQAINNLALEVTIYAGLRQRRGAAMGTR